MRSLNASEERISTVNAMATTLVSTGHRESKVIEKKCDEVNRMWAEIKELAQARLEVREKNANSVNLTFKKHLKTIMVVFPDCYIVVTAAAVIIISVIVTCSLWL